MTAATTKRTTLKNMTDDELDAAIKKSEERTAALKAQRSVSKLESALRETKIVEIFSEIVKKDKSISAIELLAAIGKNAKIPRLVVSQSESTRRAKKAKTEK